MPKPLNRFAVIGSGTLGSQIALLAADASYRVKIYDADENAFDRSLQKTRSDLENKGVSPLVPWDRWDSAKAGITQVSKLGDAVKDADLVIEAVPEDLNLKRQVWKRMGEQAGPNAILATNSSSIAVSLLEESGGRPERSLNIHFYFPLQGVNHVDVMGGTKTLPEVMETGIAWVRSIGCIPLRVKKELLGFCFNRVWRAVKKEVLYMWGNDFVDFQDIDRGWMVFTGMKEGPFALMDKVGLDVVYGIEMVYYNSSGDPKDLPPPALKDKIERGELGIKTGKGFYTYPDPEYLDPLFLKRSSE